MQFKDLIKGEKLTFLVGAGCSVDSPSCLPTGKEMIEAIIRYTCAKSEVEKLLRLKNLRLEQLLELIRECLDKKLKIIDYYGLCNKPNLQHFFLAEMIRKGHFVMTTNFDFLIELALLQSGVPKSEVKVVITKDDYKQFNAPNELFKKGIKVIYKIHGSMKNIITGESTRDDLIATFKAIGSCKEGETIFQIEPFKRPLFENIVKDRTLIVMGYSGSNDFDMVPTLKILKDIKQIIWLNHRKEDNETEIITEITPAKLKPKNKVEQLLVEIKRRGYVKRIFIVNGNITRITESLMDTMPKVSDTPFSQSVSEWFEKEIPAPNKFIQYLIPYRIYEGFSMFDDAEFCIKTILNLAEVMGNDHWKAIALSNMGCFLDKKRDLDGALEQFEASLAICEQLGALRGKATALNNIGVLLCRKGDLDKALERYKAILAIAEQLGDLRMKVTALKNIGSILKEKGDLYGALERYKAALAVAEQLGDLQEKILCLLDIGVLFERKGDLDSALERYEAALALAEQLSYLRGKANALNNIGSVLKEKGDLDSALEQCKAALALLEQLGDLREKITCLINIGVLFERKGDLDNALEWAKAALVVAEQLGDLREKITCLNYIGLILEKKGDMDGALKRFKVVLAIYEQMGDLREKAMRLNYIGTIFERKGDLDNALEQFEAALAIAEQLGDLQVKAVALNNIGNLLEEKGDLDNALEQFEVALAIAEQLGDLRGKATRLNNIGSILEKKAIWAAQWSDI